MTIPTTREAAPTVVVIGGGLAGCWAARAAAAAGAATLLVRRSLGATALSSGAIDFVPPSEAHDAGGWLERLPRHDPSHPYVTDEGVPGTAGVVDEARQLAGALGEAGLPVSVRLDDPFLLAAATGQRRWAGVAQSTIAVGDLHGPEPIAVAAVSGLASFAARSVAEAVGEARRERAAPVVVVPPPPGIDPATRDDLDDPTLARAVERPGGAEALGASLRCALDGAGIAGTTRVLVPALLGLDGPEEVAARLGRAAGVEVAETLSPPPSVPGWRLARACERVAARAGVEMLTGDVTRIEVDGDRAQAVRAADGSAIACHSLVLATGKYVGGGVVGDRRLREPLLDLPVSIGRSPADRFAASDLVERTRFAGDQPFAVAGLRTDVDGRPVDAFGRVVLRNVTVAGSLLAGVDTSLRHGGLGVLAWSARRAGRTAAASAEAAAHPRPA